MFRAVLLGIVACGLGGAAPALAQPARAEQKVALIIGNGAYPTARLRNPVNDANAIAAKLRALGFDVLLKTDVSQREMTRSFSQFGQKLTPGSVGLFYYAGHGVQVQGKNFLIPVDAEIQNETSVRTEAVDVDLVLHQLGPARLSMVILDACRNNPFERRFRGMGGGLAQIDAPTGTLIAYATAPGKTADDGPGGNGLYTTELLKAIDRPGLAVEEVFKQVRVNVLKASGNQQIPWESSSLTGEFFFRPGSPEGAAKLAEVERQRAELVKSVDDERRKREQDAEAMKRELEKLRADLAKVRELIPGTASPVPAPKVAAREEAPVKAPVKTAADPLAPSLADPVPQKRVDPAPQKLADPVPQKPVVDVPRPVALAPASSAPSSSTSSAEDWRQRMELLEKSRGQLTYARAVAILLDVASDADLDRVLRAEGVLKRHVWSSAYVLGIAPDGHICQGWSHRERNDQFAEEVALAGCKRNDRGGTCRVVMVNGVLQEKPFLEIAQLVAAGRNNVAGVRRSYLGRVPTTDPLPTGGRQR